MEKKKVLIVDDSLTTRKILRETLEKDPQIEVIGEARNGKEAVEKAFNLKPDVILMDIQMPVMNGLEATEKIISSYSVPIIIISSVLNKNQMYSSFNALAAGALDIMLKPNSKTEWQRFSKILVGKIKLFSEIKRTTLRKPFSYQDLYHAPYKDIVKFGNHFEVVAMGASTGGPGVIKEILALLPSTFSLPILIVQHMTAGFIESMVEWLRTEVKLPVKLAEDGEPVTPSVVYIAPSGKHLKVNRRKRMVLDSSSKPVNGHRPAVDVLFKSVAEVYANHSIGILLTGMGEDGALGLKQIKQKGGYTIVQDEKSCAVFGMPKAAIEINAHIKMLSPREIGEELINLTGVKNEAQKNIISR